VTTFEVVADPGSNVHALNPLIAGGRVAVGVASEKDVPLVVRTPPFVPALDRPVPPLPIGRVPVTPVVSETFVIVLFEPEMVLFVNVCEAARATRVSLEPLVSGSVSLSFAVTLLPAIVVAKVPPVFWNAI